MTCAKPMLGWRQVYITIGLLALVFSGCTKRYWYRTKIDVPHSNKYSVKIYIVNRSPNELNENFVNAMHKSAAKSLKKWGYYEAPVKSPKFIYTLTVGVDSFNKSIKHFDNKNLPEPGSIIRGKYNYSYGVGAIVFDSKMEYGPESVVKWERIYDIYYFGEKRDISRSEGVVKFLIKTAEERRYDY